MTSQLTNLFLKDMIDMTYSGPLENSPGPMIFQWHNLRDVHLYPVLQTINQLKSFTGRNTAIIRSV